MVGYEVEAFVAVLSFWTLRLRAVLFVPKSFPSFQKGKEGNERRETPNLPCVFTL